MIVVASADLAYLDRCRAAFDDDAALVEVRNFDALAPCLAQMRPRAVILDSRLPRSGASAPSSSLKMSAISPLVMRGRATSS